MKKRLITLFKQLIFLTLIGWGASSSASTISFDQSSITANKDDIFSVKVISDDIDSTPCLFGGDCYDMGGGSFSLNFDASLLEVTQVTLGPLWDGFNTGTTDNTAGMITDINVITFFGIDYSTSALDFAIIDFKAIGAGSGTLSLLAASNPFDELTDYLGFPANVQYGTASITVNAPASVPAPAAFWLMLTGLGFLIRKHKKIND